MKEMKKLLEMMELSEMNEFDNQLKLIERDLGDIIQKHNNQGVAKFDSPNLEAQLEEAIKRMQAARVGLSIVARKDKNGKSLVPPEKRKEHKSRIMSNLNIIRGIVSRIEKVLATGEGRGVDPNSKFGQMKQAATDGNVAGNEVQKNPFGEGFEPVRKEWLSTMLARTATPAKKKSTKATKAK